MSEEVIGSKSAYKATDKTEYLEKYGKLYCKLAYKGQPYSVYKGVIEFTDYSDNKIESDILFLSYGDMGGGPIYKYEIYTTTFEKTNNNWIITKFNSKDKK